ncbi:MAG: hypothetical protein OD811_03605 [Alphaproteobacteria bacterium]
MNLFLFLVVLRLWIYGAEYNFYKFYGIVILLMSGEALETWEAHESETTLWRMCLMRCGGLFFRA